MGNENTNFSIIALDKFIQATRDSGYKGTASAISEIVDNSLQANARRIKINLKNVLHSGEPSIEVSILDDGAGMDAFELRTALRFGGSSRFNDRAGLGRYGMGLPNSSLSQAQRLEVYTWREGSKSAIFSYLDLNEIAAGEVDEVPEPKSAEDFIIEDVDFYSGTLVTWRHCDRLDNKRVSTLSRKLDAVLGRKFRHFIWRGVSITINGEPVEAFDPLYLNSEAKFCGAKVFTDQRYEISAGSGDQKTGFVRVKFSELPVESWGKLKNDEKRARGITKGAGVSVVRCGREVDYGWFFFGDKRKENYDDWWRCELEFDPVLDEAFGITHTKQQIRPKSMLIEALVPQMEPVARILASRARKAHLQIKMAEKFSDSERKAATLDQYLSPLRAEAREAEKELLKAIAPKHLSTKPSPDSKQASKGVEYKIIPEPLSVPQFYDFARNEGKLFLILNQNHPFYTKLYKPLLESDKPADNIFRAKLDLMLLAASRSEAQLQNHEEITFAEQWRNAWSDILATYLNK